MFILFYSLCLLGFHNFHLTGSVWGKHPGLCLFPSLFPQEQIIFATLMQILQILDLVFYLNLPSACVSRHCFVGLCCRGTLQVMLWAVNRGRKSYQQLRQSCLENLAGWSNSPSSGKHEAML